MIDNEQIAELAVLRYIQGNVPGITREKKGNKFIYFHPDGTEVVDEKTLDRIKSLAIPPAYQQVWISPWANGHIQATGRDSKNRKQYRYHQKWSEVRQQNKFMNLVPFGESLPIIRQHIKKELSQPLVMNKKQVICAIIFLLDNYFIRIGNYIYEQQNKSYGLTTLRKKHLSLSTKQAILEFSGKNAKFWRVILKDKKMIQLLKKCEEIPGYRLFKYLDEQQVAHEVSAQEVNEYLCELTQYSFTAKDFRTWAACREMLARLITLEDTGLSLKETFKEVSSLLGHTPTICQKSYICPDIITCWQEKKLHEWYKNKLKILAQDKDKLLLAWLQDHSQR